LIQIDLHAHPLLRVRAFLSRFASPLGEIPSPHWQSVDLQRSEELRAAVRDMLRHGGYKPTGRGKPASEYLVRAAEEGGLRSINAAVDACNVVSLYSGLPISVVDADLAIAPFRIAIAPAGTSYIFNPAGQEIDVGGLVCLYDANGPIGNAVKDSQRTKTHDETRSTLSVIWGVTGFEDRLDEADECYRALIAQLPGATVEPVSLRT
jgi:DNA/RNA-binding domain of Phe-tRNA-synthetase-like protein